jgi:DHA1 family tetracycline resistance protein-like MFS transporter
MLFYQIAHDANPAVWTYYTMLKFEWTERQVGYSLGLVGVTIVLVQGVLIRIILPRLGEARAVVAGYLLMSLGFVGFAFASNSWMMIAFILPWSLGEIATPALRGIMANQVPDDAQGGLQGAITSIASLTMIGAPLLLTRLFGHFTGEGAPVYFPGAAFFTAGVMLLGALCVFGWTYATRTDPAPAT